MVKINKLVTLYEAEVELAGITFTALGSSPIEAFLAVSREVEFEFGRIISLGMAHAN